MAAENKYNKMKVKVINRVEGRETCEQKGDVRQVQRNLNPDLHPFERTVEYTRALNAAKLGKVFAKPFVSALSGKEAQSVLTSCVFDDQSTYDSVRCDTDLVYFMMKVIQTALIVSLATQSD